MPSSVIGRRSPGSITLASAARIAVSRSSGFADITRESRPMRGADRTAGGWAAQANGPGGGPSGAGPGSGPVAGAAGGGTGPGAGAGACAGAGASAGPGAGAGPAAGGAPGRQN